MLVGEAPGFYEDKSGTPFVGRAGKLLDRLLVQGGLSREQVYITNRVKCRPPQNRDPAPREREACWPWLEQEIEANLPQVCVLMGRQAASLAFPGAVMYELRQTVRVKEVGEQTVLFVPIYHPAAALRNPNLEPVIVEDFQWVKTLLASS